MKSSRVITSHIMPDPSRPNGGDSLFYRLELSESSNPKNDPTIVILHDLYDYHERYRMIKELAPDMIQGRVNFLWLDLRGFGLSGGTRHHVDDFDTYTNDIKKVLDSLQGTIGKNYIFLGVGLGCICFLRFFQSFQDQEDFHIKGMVLINPIFKFNARQSGLINRLFSPLDAFEKPMKLMRWSVKIDFRLINSRTKEVEKLYSDPLITDVLTTGLYEEIMRVALEVRETSYFIDFPLFVIESSKYNLVAHHSIDHFLKGVDKKYLSTQVYEHSFYDLLHDLDGEAALSKIFDWFHQNFLK